MKRLFRKLFGNPVWVISCGPKAEAHKSRLLSSPNGKLFVSVWGQWFEATPNNGIKSQYYHHWYPR